ncbi:DUF3299 domain-containing protein [Vibrio hepatarius]|uniref:DUF3299 domain-containing protein n=1 Tax=Vibrio hepatarius TaxID=171383 RepID=UPI001C08F5AF|nr:DUF3299 domain-containing protein [Vibrio hepatarius]MBU2895786.1 DUF3299 domain-containing protein [Vibrio hepatarius]
MKKRLITLFLVTGSLATGLVNAKDDAAKNTAQNAIKTSTENTDKNSKKDVQVKTNKDALKLDWLDLIPKSERNQLNAQGMPIANHSGKAAHQSLIGKVRQDLNGSTVKIPGFVIPLEGDANKVTEFLLVPYFGACIHVPPPPPNQIVYVKFPKGAPVQQLWDVIYVVGKLKTESISHDLAETGYMLEGTSIEEYDDY